MGYTVVQCNRCRGPLCVVDSGCLEWRCGSCGHTFPIEAFRWIGHGLEHSEALGLAEDWNRRLQRGLSWSEAVEFRRMVPT